MFEAYGFTSTMSFFVFVLFSCTCVLSRDTQLEGSLPGSELLVTDVEAVSAGSNGPLKALDINLPRNLNNRRKILAYPSSKKPSKTSKSSKRKNKKRTSNVVVLAVGLSLAAIVAFLGLAFLCRLAWGARRVGFYPLPEPPLETHTGSPRVPSFPAIPEIVIPESKAEKFREISLKTPHTNVSKQMQSPQDPGNLPKKLKDTVLGLFGFGKTNKNKIMPSPSGEIAPGPRPVHVYSYLELQRATVNFTRFLEASPQLLSSTFRAVFPNGEEASVKVLEKATLQGEGDFQAKVLYLSRLSHPNLLPILGYCSERYHKMIVHQFPSQGSLRRHLAHSHLSKLTWKDRVMILQGVAQALKYLHRQVSPPLFHRDLSPETVFLDADFTPKLGEFALWTLTDSSLVNSRAKKRFGYTDPYYLSTAVYRESSEIYSFGVLALELLSGRSPDEGLMDFVGLASIEEDGKRQWHILADSNLGKCDVDVDFENVAEILFYCVKKNPEQRPTIERVIEVLENVELSDGIENEGHISDSDGSPSFGRQWRRSTIKNPTLEKSHSGPDLSGRRKVIELVQSSTSTDEKGYHDIGF